MVSELKKRPRPRSPSFTMPVAVMNTLAGLMSRCMTRRECMCSTALQSCTKYFHTVLSGMSRFCFLKYLIICDRSPASASSSTMFSSLSSMNESKYLMMFGWFNCFRRPISLTQSCLALASIISNICTFFRATVFLSSKQVALYTSLNCPRPIFFSIWKSASEQRKDRAVGCLCGSGGCAGPRVWQRLFGFPPWGMWLGCPAILHASLTRARAARGRARLPAGGLARRPEGPLGDAAMGAVAVDCYFVSVSNP